MDGNRQGFNHSALVKAHGFRQRRHLLCIHSKIMGGYACCLKAHHFQLLTEIILAVAAGIAFSAHNLRLDGHLLSHPKARDAFSKLCDLSRNLMSLRNRILGKGMLSVVDVDIRTANADFHNFNQDLALTGLRRFHLTKFDFPRFCHHLLQHY